MRPDPQPLHRDDPDKEPLVGHVKVTREDWLNSAREVLVQDGVEHVKIMTIAKRLDVSRSSFYWYFESRSDLLHALLDGWKTTNTPLIRAHCEMPAPTITRAVCNFFRCFIHPDGFDQGLDFAIREWARRDTQVRVDIDQADLDRLAFITEMFTRYGFDEKEAEARARVLYFQQIGYHALDMSEPFETRQSLLAAYLYCFTGLDAPESEIAEFESFFLEVHQAPQTG